MKKVWVAYTDSYENCHKELGKIYSYASDAIHLKGIFDSELYCRRYCMEHNCKCKAFDLHAVEEEPDCGESSILTCVEEVC